MPTLMDYTARAIST